MTSKMASTVYLDTPDVTASSDLERIRGEYTEMPGLKLTVRQAARLWGLAVPQSEQLLSELVDSRFLVADASGAYRRRGCVRCS